MLDSFTGVRIFVSEHATALPTAQPRTLDMREMVEHMHRLGLVRRLPACFQTSQGMVVHPEILTKLRRRMAANIDAIAFSAMTGGSEGVAKWRQP